MDDKRHGKVNITITASNGTIHYEGDDVAGKKHGKGKYTAPDGAIYEGDFVDDKQHGKGKYTTPNGAIYEGDFVDDKQHGKGKYTYPSSLSVYEGDFVYDKKHGKGKLTIKNGTAYITNGDVYDDVYDVYEGDFDNDKILTTLTHVYTKYKRIPTSNPKIQVNTPTRPLLPLLPPTMQQKECPVCFESVDHLLLCGHGMCKTCIDMSVTRALFSCPICREKNVMGQPIKR